MMWLSFFPCERSELKVHLADGALSLEYMAFFFFFFWPVKVNALFENAYGF